MEFVVRGRCIVGHGSPLPHFASLSGPSPHTGLILTHNSGGNGVIRVRHARAGLNPPRYIRKAPLGLTASAPLWGFVIVACSLRLKRLLLVGAGGRRDE